MNYGPKLLLAILTYVIGSWLISRANKPIDVALEKSHTGISLRSFLRSLIFVTLKLLLVISVDECIVASSEIGLTHMDEHFDPDSWL